MRIEALLRRAAADDPGKIAVIAGDTLLSYAQLDDYSDRLAGALQVHGVKRGDRVIVFMENAWETTVAIFAALKAGAVFCPVNPSTKADGLAYVMRDCRPRAVLTQAKFATLCMEVGIGLPDGPLIIATSASTGPAAGAISFGDCMAAETSGLISAGDENDLAMIIYTSGSTGRPKGVMLTHAAMDAVSASIEIYLENSAQDVVLSVLPLSFTYGLHQLVATVRVGATLVLEKSFAFPHAILEAAREHGATVLPLVPTMAAILLSMQERPSLPSLRAITNAAAPLPPVHLEGLRNMFPGTRLFSMYGMTECARATYLPPEELDRRPGSVGKAIPGTQAIVVDEAGRPAGVGMIGELVVSGPHLMSGYWENPEATEAALRTGVDGRKRLHTGDLFRADSDGFLYFVGRMDDMLKIKGEKVAPRQVEAVICACPGVVEAVVAGVPDDILGVALHAVVVASDPALTARAVILHCSKNLTDFMVPKTVEFRAELPKTPSGKVIRRLAAVEGDRN